jgi:diguanylate cyclase (GGDEF)-like protein
MRIFQKLVMPGGLVVLAAVLATQILPASEQVPTFARALPFVIFATGALLGSRFHSSQMVLALVTLTLATWAVHFFSAPERVAEVSSADVLAAVTVLLPLNFALLCLSPGRGIITPGTLSRLGGIMVQAALIAMFCVKWPGEISASLGFTFVDLPLPGGTLTQPGWIAFAGILLLLPAQHVVLGNPMVGGMFWALFAALLALNADPAGLGFILFMSTAGLVLIVSQVESSYLLAFRDELTELPTRRALNHALTRLGKRYTIAMVDIDHFKKFNDSFGHKIGDELLRMVGFKLAAVTGGGMAFRYGGEEFALLFPGKRADEAMPHIESILVAIRSNHFTIREPRTRQGSPDVPVKAEARQKVRVTVSIGVAQDRTPAEVLHEADAALYRAKDSGRNQIVS